MNLNATPRQIVVLVAAVLVGGGSFIGIRVGEGGSPNVVTEAADGADIHLALPAASDADLAALSQPVEPADPSVGADAPPKAPATGQKAATTAHDHTPQAPHNHDADAVQNFVDNVTRSLGAQMLAPDQAATGGWQRINATTISAQSPISGVRPVVEQAIDDVKKNNKRLTGPELESQIAKRLTELNDWDNLNGGTKGKMMILSGINIEAMTNDQRENKVNHVLHSPLPFGDIDEVLTPDTTIDLGYTHTLDKTWTKVQSLGKGVFQIWMVSNNNNGSHTGHNLGSFKVQLPVGTTNDKAREVGNNMVINKNDNDRLLLDPAAKKILYGQTPPLDYSKPIPTTTTAPPTTAAPVTTAAPTTAPPTTPAPTTTSTTASTTTSTTAASSSSSAKP